MPEQMEVLVATVRDLAHRGQTATAVAVVDGLHPSDLAAVLSGLPHAQRGRLVEGLDAPVAARAVWELDDEERAATLDGLQDTTVVGLIEALPDDGAADLIQDVPPLRRAALLRGVSPSRIARLEPLLGHDEATAGGLMSPRFVAVDRGARVRDALEVLRAHRDTAFVYYVYVMDHRGHPLGVTSLRELVVADPSSLVEAVSRADLIAVTPATDQEEVARLASRYDLLAVPVVTEEGRMVGVVTADDVLEVLSSEAEEDVERFVGLEPGPARQGLVGVAAGRLPWVMATFGLELAIAYLFLRPLPATSSRTLLAFLPLLLFTGGTSSIAAAGVALRRIVRGDRKLLRLVGLEMQGGLLLGIVAAAAVGAILVLAGRELRLAGVIAVSTGLTVVISSAVGTFAPVVLWGLGRDPARASGPLLGAVADAAALSVYLIAARAFL